jgi:hypothetical protein
MSLPVILSETALLTFDTICNQVLERLGNKALNDFKKNTLKTLALIGNSPLIYKQSEFDPSIRIGLVKRYLQYFMKLSQIG